MSQKMWRSFAPLLLLFASGCVLTSHYHCRKWQNQGLMVSTLDSCKRCVDQFGSGNFDLIRGCAVGMDAATLLEAQRLQTAAPHTVPAQ